MVGELIQRIQENGRLQFECDAGNLTNYFGNRTFCLVAQTKGSGMFIRLIADQIMGRTNDNIRQAKSTTQRI